jgi:hypothetical protein
VRPLPRPEYRPAPAAIAAVQRLAYRLDTVVEPVALARLGDDTLAPLVDALTVAADLAGKWLTDREAVAMAAALEPFEREAAAERQASTQGNKQSGSVKFTGPAKGDARDKIADAVGMSAPTLTKADHAYAAAKLERLKRSVRLARAAVRHQFKSADAPAPSPVTRPPAGREVPEDQPWSLFGHA